MRAITWENVFDGALIWFTTFGYFGDSNNENVISQVAKALKPGARILIEQINRVSLLRGGMPATWTVTRGDDIMIDCVDYDGLAERVVTERIVDNVSKNLVSTRVKGWEDNLLNITYVKNLSLEK